MVVVIVRGREVGGTGYLTFFFRDDADDDAAAADDVFYYYYYQLGMPLPFSQTF